MFSLTKKRWFYVSAKFDERSGASSTAAGTMLVETGLFSGRPTAAGMRYIGHNFTKFGAANANRVIILFMQRVVN